MLGPGPATSLFRWILQDKGRVTGAAGTHFAPAPPHHTLARHGPYTQTPRNEFRTVRPGRRSVRSHGFVCYACYVMGTAGWRPQQLSRRARRRGSACTYMYMHGMWHVHVACACSKEFAISPMSDKTWCEQRATPVVMTHPAIRQERRRHLVTFGVHAGRAVAPVAGAHVWNALALSPLSTRPP